MASGIPVITSLVKLFSRLTGSRDPVSVNREDETNREILNALRVSEDKLRAAFTISPDAISITRMSDGKYIDVNNGFLETSCYSRDEVVGKSVYEINIWDNLHDREILTDALQKKGYITDLEAVFNKKNGQKMTGLMSARIFDIQGVPHLIAFTRDITERKRAELALQQSEEKYRLLAEHSDDVIWIMNTDLQFTYVSPSVMKLRGYTPEEVAKQSVYEVVTPESGMRIRDLLTITHQQIANGNRLENPSPVLIEQPRKDGTTVWTEAVVKPIYDESGKHTGYLGVSRDITERLQAEKELKKTEIHFKALIENAPDGVVLIGMDGKFKYISPSAFRMFSYDLDDAAMGDPETMTHPDDLPMVQECLGRLMADPGYVPVLQYRFLAKDGTYRWIESKFTNMLGEPAVEAIVINFRDIDDRKKSEEELQGLYQSLEKRVEKRTSELISANQELEAFAYTVSHDLRAPVRAIGGFTKILEEDFFPDLDQEGRRIFKVITENTHKMERLIDDLLSFSRLSRTGMNLGIINMAEMVWKCYEELTDQETRRKIKLTVCDFPLVKGDHSMMIQVWANLLSNAIKYTSHCDHPEISISTHREERDIVFTIADNGIGFDMKYVDKLFGVFQRLHSEKEFEGTGVGLAIVQRVIHRHGGRIWAKGEIGKGASFSFTLKSF